MSTTLLIREFLKTHQAAGRPRLPLLERILARAVKCPPRHTTACLAELFGVLPTDVAEGPFMRLADGGAPDKSYWLRADPVHLAPDRDQLVLMPESLLQVLHEELQALAAVFNATYRSDGWRLEFPHAQRGYLRSPRTLNAVTHDPAPFMGGPVLAAMPDGADGPLLRQLMNETQMLFHTHAVNTSREERGMPAINSLWFWGGGNLPAAGSRAPRRVFSELPLVRGMALWAERPPLSPTKAVELADGDLAALPAEDLESLERDWFGPLFNAVKGGTLAGLDLHLEGLGDFQLAAAGARRFWRWGRALP